MPSSILGIPEVAPTQTDKTTTINQMVDAVERSQEDLFVVDMSGGDVTLTALEYTRAKVFRCIDAPADQVLTVPSTKRTFWVKNVTLHTITVGGVTGAAIAVASGDGAVIQNDSVDCFLFGTGGPGATGATGNAGGGVSIPYTFSTTTTNADPGSGTLRLNNATQSSATAIYLDLDDSLGTTWTTVLDALDDSTNAIKGEVRLFKASDPSKWIVFDLTAVTSHTGYRELTVIEVGASASSPLVNSDAIMLCFSRTGDGTSLNVHNDFTASQAVVPVALTDGASIALDLDLSNTYTLTIGGNRTLLNPTNWHAGMGFVIVVTQDATGGRTLDFDTHYFSPGGGSIALSTAAGAVDILSCHTFGTSSVAVTILGNMQVIP